MKEVDARGLSCPIPVVMTKKVMDAEPETEITVLLDAEVAKENVSRLASGKGYGITIEKTGDDYKLILKPGTKD